VKIKYKLTIIFVIIILSASLPLSLYNLHSQKNNLIDTVIREGKTNSKILSKILFNILLMNAGDISGIKVDAGDMLSSYRMLKNSGLLYADMFLLTEKNNQSGLVLSSIVADETYSAMFTTQKYLSDADYKRVINSQGFNEIQLPGIGSCYEFVSIEYFENKKPVCGSRLIFSSDKLNKPFIKMRRIVLYSSIAAVAFSILLAFLFSQIFTKPIYNLMDDVRNIETGDITYSIKRIPKDEVGKLARTFNDFSRIVKLQINELAQTNKNLIKLDAMKDDFLANISHELRTPLYGIIGMTESVLDGASGELAPKLQHDLSIILSSGKRLTNLVNDILDFSRLKNDDISLKKVSVDVNSVVSQVVEMMGAVIAKKNLKVTNDIGRDAYYIFADEERFLQVMMNIIGNSIKFTEDGYIKIFAQNINDGRDVLIAVQDSGIGIPGEMLDKVFDLFIQADSKNERLYGGTGLGLTISKKIVELHGGNIRAESDSTNGSTFYITMNSFKGDLSEKEKLNKKSHLMENVKYDFPDIKIPDNAFLDKKATKGYIMVVDDESYNLQIIINILLMENFFVAAFKSIYEALKLIEDDGPPDILLLDIMMPGISGYEACRQLREKFSQYELPIVMLSAKGRIEDIITGIELGANDYLVKPINKMELLARINNLLSLKKSIRDHDDLFKIRRDIEIAHEIQKNLLKINLPDTKKDTFSLRYVPMYELGGDFYDIRSIKENIINLLIADVSGHGISAAILCCMLKMAYEFHLEYSDKPDILMTKINKTMFEYLGDNFITGLYACIDYTNNKMVFANAGHWPAVLYRKSCSQFFIDDSGGIPIGWTDDCVYHSGIYAIEKGDRVIFFTDCLVEAKNSEKLMFSKESLLSLLKENIDLSPDEFSSLTIMTIRKWAGLKDNDPLDDDATLIVVDI